MNEKGVGKVAVVGVFILGMIVGGFLVSSNIGEKVISKVVSEISGENIILSSSTKTKHTLTPIKDIVRNPEEYSQRIVTVKGRYKRSGLSSGLMGNDGYLLPLLTSKAPYMKVDNEYLARGEVSWNKQTSAVAMITENIKFGEGFEKEVVVFTKTFNEVITIDAYEDKNKNLVIDYKDNSGYTKWVALAIYDENTGKKVWSEKHSTNPNDFSVIWNEAQVNIFYSVYYTIKHKYLGFDGLTKGSRLVFIG